MNQSSRSGFHYHHCTRLILVISMIILAAPGARSQQLPASPSTANEPAQSQSQNPPAPSPQQNPQQPAQNPPTSAPNPGQPNQLAQPSTPPTPAAQSSAQTSNPLALSDAVQQAIAQANSFQQARFEELIAAEDVR